MKAILTTFEMIFGKLILLWGKTWSRAKPIFFQSDKQCQSDRQYSPVLGDTKNLGISTHLCNDKRCFKCSSLSFCPKYTDRENPRRDQELLTQYDGIEFNPYKVDEEVIISNNLPSSEITTFDISYTSLDSANR